MNRNFEKMFDVACNAETGKDYKFPNSDGRGMSPEEQSTFLRLSVNRFVFDHTQDVVSGNGNETVKLRAFSGSADLPQLTKDVFNVTQQTPEYDMGWAQVFRTIPLLQGQLNWEIASTGTGVTFRAIPEGNSVEIYSLKGEKKLASIQKYGTGFGVSWEMIEGRKLYQFVQALEDIRNKLYRLWADIHYGILVDAAKTTRKTATKYDTIGSNELVKDINTLNAAYLKVAEVNKDSGYGMTSNTPMRLFVSPKLLPRINAALGASRSDLTRSSGTGVTVPFPIQVTGTWTDKIKYDDTTEEGILVLPGNKIQNAVYMREMGFRSSDNLTLSDIQTYWSAFGAIVGDTNQVELVKFK